MFYRLGYDAHLFLYIPPFYSSKRCKFITVRSLFPFSETNMRILNLLEVNENVKRKISQQYRRFMLQNVLKLNPRAGESEPRVHLVNKLIFANENHENCSPLYH